MTVSDLDMTLDVASTAETPGADRTTPALSVVIPAYNEAQAIEAVLADLLPVAEANRWEVLAVNDGSTDSTEAILDALQDAHQPTLKVIHHGRNRGYGASLKSGVRRARAPLIAMMDSDGQHTTDHLRSLLPHADRNDMVIGQRTALVHSPLWRMPGKWLLTLMAVYLLGERIPDLNSGLRVVHAAVLRRYLHLFPNGFSFSTTSTMVLLSRGYGVHYVPIDVRQRAGKSSVSLRTGFNTLLLILRLAMLIAPLHIFLPLSAASTLLGVTWALPYLLARRGLTTAALLMLINGIVIFLVGLVADQIAELRKERFEFPESDPNA